MPDDVIRMLMMLSISISSKQVVSDDVIRMLMMMPINISRNQAMSDDVIRMLMMLPINISSKHVMSDDVISPSASAEIHTGSGSNRTAYPVTNSLGKLFDKNTSQNPLCFVHKDIWLYLIRKCMFIFKSIRMRGNFFLKPFTCMFGF